MYVHGGLNRLDHEFIYDTEGSRVWAGFLGVRDCLAFVRNDEQGGEVAATPLRLRGQDRGMGSIAVRADDPQYVYDAGSGPRGVRLDACRRTGSVGCSTALSRGGALTATARGDSCVGALPLRSSVCRTVNGEVDEILKRPATDPLEYTRTRQRLLEAPVVFTHTTRAMAGTSRSGNGLCPPRVRAHPRAVGTRWLGRGAERMPPNAYLRAGACWERLGDERRRADGNEDADRATGR